MVYLKGSFLYYLMAVLCAAAAIAVCVLHFLDFKSEETVSAEYTVLLLKTGEKAYVTDASGGNRNEMPQSLMLNINTASAEELACLQGIGKKLAEKIIEYRDRYGLFRYPYEITYVSGISEAVYESIKNEICVN